MTLRARLALLVAAAVAVAIAMASVAAFLVTRAELRDQVDQSLLGFSRLPDQAVRRRLPDLEQRCAAGPGAALRRRAGAGPGPCAVQPATAPP